MPTRKPKLHAEPVLKRSAVRRKTRAEAPALEVPAPEAAPPQGPPPLEARQPATPTTKLEQVIVLLSRAEGATIAQMVELTGWKARSVRGFMAGALKAKRGLVITSAKAEGVRTYRIEAP